MIPSFIPSGAEAYKRDNPNALMGLLDTGHFALETHVAYIAQRIRETSADDNNGDHTYSAEQIGPCTR